MLKNLGFVCFCLAATGALAWWVIPADRIDPLADVAQSRVRDQGDRGRDLDALVAAIDEEFQKVWQEKGIESASECPPDLIARRLSLALTGTIPSLEEIRRLEEVPAGLRADWWVNYLLNDRRYADYVGERFARAYVGTEDGPFLVYRRRRFVHWISDRLVENVPYDQLVQQLLTDKGLWTDSPAVNFISVTLDQNADNQPDPIRLAARTSRAFLGLRIDCLQCHDDNLGTMDLGDQGEERGGTQQDFHQLAAFFSGVQSSLRGIQDNADDKDYEYQYLDDDDTSVVPVSVPYRGDLLPVQGSRRERLAKWVTHDENGPFARAIVNRVWALMCGRPLVEPVDDLPLHGPFPPGLETLAKDLVDHDYDLQRLIVAISKTEAFRKDSRAEFDITPVHEQNWAVFPVTRLRPEQVAGAAIQASSLRTINDRASTIEKLSRFGQEQEFVDRFGDLGEDEFNLTGGTIPQRLIMMNGELIDERTKPNDVLLNAPAQIATLSPDDDTAIRTAYRVVLTREPTTYELEHFVRRIKDSNGEQRRNHLGDLYWVLVNSSEFSWNH